MNMKLKGRQTFWVQFRGKKVCMLLCSTRYERLAKAHFDDRNLFLIVRKIIVISL